jgi:hypothetical protein
MEVGLFWGTSFQNIKSSFKNETLKIPKAGVFNRPGLLIFNNGWYHWQSVNNGFAV